MLHMDYIALATYLFVMIVTPGPNDMMVTASGANFGYLRTVPHLLGICLGCSLQTLLACLGLGAIFVRFPLLHTILLWVGLVYMLYLAWKILGIKLKNDQSVPEPLTIIEAALFQIVNAKAWVVSLTVASLFLPHQGSLVIPTLIIVAMVIVVTYSCASLWAMFGSAMRNILQNERNRMVFNIVMAVLLVITAIMIVVK